MAMKLLVVIENIRNFYKDNNSVAREITWTECRNLFSFLFDRDREWNIGGFNVKFVKKVQ